jgi:hypothetical protein
MTYMQVTTLAYYHQMSGGVGLESLTVPPKTTTMKNSSAKVFRVLEKEHPPPDVEPVLTPVHDKNMCIRRTEHIPVLVPTKMEMVKRAQETAHKDSLLQYDPDVLAGKLNHDAYLQHPVVTANSHLHWSSIRPVAIFCDGALLPIIN